MRSLAILTVFLTAFFSCTEEDNCADIFCDNDGLCIDGECECREGWIGPTCSRGDEPNKVIVSNIKVTSMPALDGSGNEWDNDNTGPDINFVFVQNTDTIYFEDQVISEVDVDVEYNFSANNIEFTNWQEQITLFLIEEDDSTSLPMGGINFTIYTQEVGPQDLYELTSEGDLAFELSLDYDFPPK